MIRMFLTVFAGIGLTLSSPALAQSSYAESGWRAATAEEKKIRQLYEKAQDDWNPKKDGEAAQYECILRWASWGNITRDEPSDEIPAISGELMYTYADGHLSHHISALIAKEGGNIDSFTNKFAEAAVAYANRPNESFETIIKNLGKCHIPPLSWQIAEGRYYTSPMIVEMIGDKGYYDTFPVFVKNKQKRKEFDDLIIKKDFVGAANLGAALHGANDKTTVMWNEVLRASLLSVWSGRGTELSAPLLHTLSKVWWPKYRKDWAKNLLRQKQGLASNSSSGRPPLHDPGKEPAWVKQEYDRFMRGETNYTPCNAWRRAHC